MTDSGDKGPNSLEHSGLRIRLSSARTKFLRRTSGSHSESSTSPQDRSSSRPRVLRRKSSFPIGNKHKQNQSLPANPNPQSRPATRDAPPSGDATPGPSHPVPDLTLDNYARSPPEPEPQRAPFEDKRLSKFKTPLVTVQQPSPALRQTFPESETPDVVETGRPPSPSGAVRPHGLPTPPSRATSVDPESPELQAASDLAPSEQQIVSTPGVTSVSSESEKPLNSRAISSDYFGKAMLEPVSERPSFETMSKRKIWVSRPGGSPTMIQVNRDDLVDDVRDMIVRKYANSVGRQFDSPDVTLRLIPRTQTTNEGPQLLLPNEPIAALIDKYYPSGQRMEEALLVEVPSMRRTPRPSPNTQQRHYYHEDARPHEDGGGYFPPMPVASSPHGQNPPMDTRQSSYQSNQHPHSMQILETGTLPPLPAHPGSAAGLPLPSPGGTVRRGPRPKTVRHTTASPVVQSSVSAHQPLARAHRRQDSATSDFRHGSLPHPNPSTPLPTPPANELAPTSAALSSKASTPPVDNRVSSPRPPVPRKKKSKIPAARNGMDHGAAPPPQVLSPHNRLLGTASIPPINVLIVEDNIINLKLLEEFARRLKVRWTSAMNGQDAVRKWRQGGYHLVFMDIGLPIMNGLQATREIRRLERVSNIGVFAKEDMDDRRDSIVSKSNGVNGDIKENTDDPGEDDKLPLELFKAPVIIVALTASSLQSDRNDALAAGCNDFLTKPVGFAWLQRKVMEWGCMQALIDYDGWRQWKQYADKVDEKKKEEDAKLDPAERETREKKEQRKRELMEKFGKK